MLGPIRFCTAPYLFNEFAMKQENIRSVSCSAFLAIFVVACLICLINFVGREFDRMHPSHKKDKSEQPLILNDILKTQSIPKSLNSMECTPAGMSKEQHFQYDCRIYFTEDETYNATGGAEFWPPSNPNADVAGMSFSISKKSFETSYHLKIDIKDKSLISRKKATETITEVLSNLNQVILKNTPTPESQANLDSWKQGDPP